VNDVDVFLVANIITSVTVFLHCIRHMHRICLALCSVSHVKPSVVLR
jgi:hypothetical protein